MEEAKANEGKSANEPNRAKEAKTQKWTPANWDKFKKSDKEIRAMVPQNRSRYLAYEETPKDIAVLQASTSKRITDQKKEATKAALNGKPTSQEILDKEKHDKLIGQLKAAEARNHIRVMRLQYELNRTHAINELIAAQPTAVKAVRLQALLQTKAPTRIRMDGMTKTDRQRVECLVNDLGGLLTNRT